MSYSITIKEKHNSTDLSSVKKQKSISNTKRKSIPPLIVKALKIIKNSIL